MKNIVSDSVDNRILQTDTDHRVLSDDSPDKRFVDDDRNNYISQTDPVSAVVVDAPLVYTNRPIGLLLSLTYT